MVLRRCTTESGRIGELYIAIRQLRLALTYIVLARGLKDILKAGPDSYVEDKQVVIEKASYFSVDFLSSVGYYF